MSWPQLRTARLSRADRERSAALVELAAGPELELELDALLEVDRRDEAIEAGELYLGHYLGREVLP